MGKLDPAAAQCHAEFLRKVVQHAYSDSNEALRDLAVAQRPEIRCATQADFRYVDPRSEGGMPRTIPIAQFHRQYALCLQSLELTFYGYCVQKQFGWERVPEIAFSMRRPAFWRRVLRPAPLLAFRMRAEHSGVSITIHAAQCTGYVSKVNHTVRLDQELQQQLVQVNAEQIGAHSVKTRLSAWLNRLRKKPLRQQ